MHPMVKVVKTTKSKFSEYASTCHVAYTGGGKCKG